MLAPKPLPNIFSVVLNFSRAKAAFKSSTLIFKLGYSRVLLETGLVFLSSVVEKKLINNLYLFKSKNKLKRNGKNNVSSNFLKKLRFKLIPINLDNDKLLIKEF